MESKCKGVISLYLHPSHMINRGNCEEEGQVKLRQAGHRLPGQVRKSGLLKPIWFLHMDTGEVSEL